MPIQELNLVPYFIDEEPKGLASRVLISDNHVEIVTEPPDPDMSDPICWIPSWEVSIRGEIHDLRKKFWEPIAKDVQHYPNYYRFIDWVDEVHSLLDSEKMRWVIRKLQYAIQWMVQRGKFPTPRAPLVGAKVPDTAPAPARQWLWCILRGNRINKYSICPEIRAKMPFTKGWDVSHLIWSLAQGLYLLRRKIDLIIT
jgi:hypothetical protein